MRLDMTSGYNFLTALRYQRTSHPDLVAHVDQQAGHASRHFLGGISARGTRELVQVGRAEAGDGRTEATPAENMVALETNGVNEGTVADRAHQVRVVLGDEIKAAEID